MRRFELTDEQWEKIKHLLPGKAGDSGRTAKDNRLFLDAVLWTARTGAQWRDLPARFGNWNSIYQRFNRWAKAGRWQAIFEQMQDPDLEWLLIDSTIVRAHQHAAGALKKGETKRWDDLGEDWEPRSTLPAKGLGCQYASC
jgi:transposase